MSGVDSVAVPALSVVVPVYRVAEYLPVCLDSILSQAGPDVEVVAVDDHCPDGGGAMLDAYARRDRRVRVVHLAANVGLGRARNAGLEQARGTYVWFVDSDDWLPPGALPAVRRRLADTRPDVLAVDHVEVLPDGTVRGTTSGPVLRGVREPVRVTQHPELLQLTLATSACTKVIRREFLATTGLRFPPGWYEDCAYTFPLLLAAERVATLDQVAYCYRRRDGGAITGSVSDRHFDVFEQYERMWRRVEDAAGAYHELRPLLFRLMIDHLLVIVGHERRLPAARRREFFGRIAAEYHRRLPPGGYPIPGGAGGLKHRLVREESYAGYALLRLLWRGLRLRQRRPAPGYALPVPHRAVDQGPVRQGEAAPAGQVGMGGAQVPHPPLQLPPS